MPSESTSTRPKASLGTTKVNNPGVLARAKIMYAAFIAAVASFPSPTVTMVAFLALIQAFEAAQDATPSGTKGLARIRNTKRNAVWSAMETLRACVQTIADTMQPENAAVLIESAGLLVAGTAAHPKPILQAKLTTTFRGRAPHRELQDPGGEEVQERDVPLGLEARTTARPGTRCPRRRSRTP